MDIMLVKTPGGALAPVDAEAREMVDKLKLAKASRQVCAARAMCGFTVRAWPCSAWHTTRGSR